MVSSFQESVCTSIDMQSTGIKESVIAMKILFDSCMYLLVFNFPLLISRHLGSHWAIIFTHIHSINEGSKHKLSKYELKNSNNWASPAVAHFILGTIFY